MTLVLPPQLKPPQLHDKVLLALPPTLHQHAVKMARASHLIYVMRQHSSSSQKPNSLNFPAIFNCRDASAGVGRLRLRSFLKNHLVCTVQLVTAAYEMTLFLLSVFFPVYWETWRNSSLKYISAEFSGSFFNFGLFQWILNYLYHLIFHPIYRVKPNINSP